MESKCTIYITWKWPDCIRQSMEAAKAADKLAPDAQINFVKEINGSPSLHRSYVNLNNDENEQSNINSTDQSNSNNNNQKEENDLDETSARPSAVMGDIDGN